MEILIPYLKDADRETRYAAIISVPYTEQSLEVLEALLFDDDFDLRLYAITRLSEGGQDVTTKVREKLGQAKGEARLRLALAMHGLVDIGEDAGLVSISIDHNRHVA